MIMTEIETIKKLLCTETQLSDFVEDYEHLLSIHHPQHVKPYRDRLKRKESREGAQSEAVVFPFLKGHHGQVDLEEDTINGGTDFRCNTTKSQFVVEVTCLGSEFVTSQTGLPNVVGSSGHYDMLPNRKLRQRASKKANQIKRYKCPAVLVLASMHTHARALLDTESAAQLLRGKRVIEISHNYLGKTSSVKEVADPTDCTFFRWKNGRLESCRRNISAILLFAISGANADVIGILHPDSYYEFPIEFLPSVPFGRLKEWPLEHDRIRMEWISHNEGAKTWMEPAKFWYDEMRSTLSNGTT